MLAAMDDRVHDLIADYQRKENDYTAFVAANLEEFSRFCASRRAGIKPVGIVGLDATPERHPLTAGAGRGRQ